MKHLIFFLTLVLLFSCGGKQTQQTGEASSTSKKKKQLVSRELAPHEGAYSFEGPHEGFILIINEGDKDSVLGKYLDFDGFLPVDSHLYMHHEVGLPGFELDSTKTSFRSFMRKGYFFKQKDSDYYSIGLYQIQKLGDTIPRTDTVILEFNETFTRYYLQ